MSNYRKLSSQTPKTILGSTAGRNVYVADGTVNVAKKQSNILKIKHSWRVCEIIFLTTTMVVIIGLFTIPTVYYALPPQEPQVSSVIETCSYSGTSD